MPHCCHPAICHLHENAFRGPPWKRGIVRCAPEYGLLHLERLYNMPKIYLNYEGERGPEHTFVWRQSRSDEGGPSSLTGRRLKEALDGFVASYRKRYGPGATSEDRTWWISSGITIRYSFLRHHLEIAASIQPLSGTVYWNSTRPKLLEACFFFYFEFTITKTNY